MQHQRGFTLVELITVMVIIGLISAVAIPRFFDNQSFDNRGYYTEVINAVRYAQQLAVAINCNTQVVLTSGTPSMYRVRLDDDNLDCTGATFNTLAPNPVTGQPSFTGSSSSTNITASTFGFSALGAPFNNLGNPLTANLDINVGGSQFRVNAVTGYIEEL